MRLPKKLADAGAAPDAGAAAQGAGCLVLSDRAEAGAAAPSGGPAPHGGSAYRLQAQALAGLTRRPQRKSHRIAVAFFAGRRAGSGRQALLDLRLGLAAAPRGRWCSSCSNSSACSLQLLLPGGLVDAGDGLELLGGEVQAGPVQVFVARADAEDVLGARRPCLRCGRSSTSARACSRRSRARRTCRPRPCGTS